MFKLKMFQIPGYFSWFRPRNSQQLSGVASTARIRVPLCLKPPARAIREFEKVVHYFSEFELSKQLLYTNYGNYDSLSEVFRIAQGPCRHEH